MRVVLVRHYKTINNEARRIMGWGDAPRAADWESDLLQVDAFIRQRGIHFDAFYSSALVRARETLRYFAGIHGCSQVHASPALNEVNYGDLFQYPKRWVVENCPEYKTDADFVFPGGESFHQMQRRNVEFVLSLQHAHTDDNLLIVTHAGVIRGLVAHFLCLDLAANLKRKVSHRYIGELVIEHDGCVYYDEIGMHSGFVRDGIVEVPWCSKPAGPVRRESSQTTPTGVSVDSAINR
jgi:alpha-ribazole phosphatase